MGIRMKMLRSNTWKLLFVRYRNQYHHHVRMTVKRARMRELDSTSSQLVPPPSATNPKYDINMPTRLCH